MTPLQQLDAAFPNVLAMVVGQCMSVPIPAILNALGSNDPLSALATFQAWCQARGLIGVMLTVNVMMVGRHLV